MAVVSASLSADGKHGAPLTAAVFIAIGIGAYPILKCAVLDLSRRRLGTAFCVSLALAFALAVREYSVALNLLLFAVLTKTVEDWAAERSRKLLFARAGLSGPETAAEDTLRSVMFDRSTASWLQQFFGYLAIATAAITLVTTGGMRSAVAVLTIGSASALTASMCVLALGSAAHALSHRLQIRDEKFMERLAAVDIAVFDEFEEAHNDSHEKAKQAIRLLREMKVETVLFTSALQSRGEALGKMLGVDAIEAELFPDDKPCKIAAFRRKHRRVVFLGGGTEAAPSFAVADVGIVARAEPKGVESGADAFLLSNDLNDFAQVVRIARRANRIATASFAVAVIVSSAAVGLAIQGKVTPQWAIAVRFLLELALMLSAAQLLTPLWREKPAEAKG